MLIHCLVGWRRMILATIHTLTYRNIPHIRFPSLNGKFNIWFHFGPIVNMSAAEIVKVYC